MAGEDGFRDDPDAVSLLEKSILGLGENHDTSSRMYKHRGRLERTEK